MLFYNFYGTLFAIKIKADSVDLGVPLFRKNNFDRNLNQLYNISTTNN